MRVKFISRNYAEAFIRQHAGKKEFPYRYDGFWCGMSQTPEERIKFKKEFMALFKGKKAFCEITQHDASQIVDNKIDQNI